MGSSGINARVHGGCSSPSYLRKATIHLLQPCTASLLSWPLWPVLSPSQRLNQRLMPSPGTHMATVVFTGHIPMDPTTHAPIAMVATTFTSVRLRLNQSPRLTPGTPMATVVSTDHIPMEPTTHAPMAMVATTFSSVRLRLRLTHGTDTVMGDTAGHTPTVATGVTATHPDTTGGTEDLRVKTCFNCPKFSQKRVPLKNHSCPFSYYINQTASLRNEKGFFSYNTQSYQQDSRNCVLHL